MTRSISIRGLGNRWVAVGVGTAASLGLVVLSVTGTRAESAPDPGIRPEAPLAAGLSPRMESPPPPPGPPPLVATSLQPAAPPVPARPEIPTVTLTARYVSVDEHFKNALEKTKRGDIPGAIADYDRVICMGPTHAPAHNNRGMLKKKQKDYAGALEDLNRALELRPGFADALGNRGGVRQSMGDLPGCIEDWEAALRNAPSGWAHREMIAQALERARSRIKR